MKLAPGHVLGEKYRLVRFLGEGSQAVVWEAAQEGAGGFSKRVVLKIIHPDAVKNDDFRVMLINEARNAANLRHPNIVEFYDIGEDGPLLYIAMEFIEGWDLHSILHQRMSTEQTPLPWHIVAHLICGVCQGLAHAHHFQDSEGRSLSLIHRDIKPANILVSKAGQAKLIDFGIAKSSASTTRTKTGVIKGTPAFMAPEQARGGALDHRADLFSLGVTMYKLCSGQEPFPYDGGDNAFINTLMKIITEPHVPLDPTAHGLPRMLVSLIDQMLAKDPNIRPQDASSIQEKLEQIMRAEGRIQTNRGIGLFVTSLMTQGKEAHGVADWTVTQDDPDAFVTKPDIALLSNDLPSGSLIEGVFDEADEPSASVAASKPEPGAPERDASRTGGTLSMAMDASKHIHPAWYVIYTLFFLALVGGGSWWLFGSQRFGVTRPSDVPKEPRAPGRQKASAKAAKQRPPTPAHAKKAPTKTIAPSTQLQNTTIKRPVAVIRRSAPRRQPLRRLRPTRVRRRAVVRRRRRVARARRRRAAAAPGFVLFDIEPPCRLFSGGTSLGVARALLVKRPPGRHRFRCLHPPSRLLRFFSVQVKSGQSARIKKRYRSGKLFVLSFPWADVYLPPFGRLGRSQALLTLPEGRHRILLYQKGDEKKQRSLKVVIRPGKVTRPLVRWGR